MGILWFSSNIGKAAARACFLLCGLAWLFCTAAGLAQTPATHRDSLIYRLSEAEALSGKQHRETLLNLCRAYLDVFPDSAVLYGGKAAMLYEDARDTLGMADCERIIGIAWYNKGDYAKALAHYHGALVLFEKKHDLHGQASVLNNIGNLYDANDDMEKALEHFKNSLALHQKEPACESLVAVLNNLGGMYLYLEGQAAKDSAIRYLDQALLLIETRPESPKTYTAQIFNNLARAYEFKDDFPNARKFYFKALEIKEAAGDAQGTARSLIDIGKYFMRRGSLGQAQEYVEKGLATAKKCRSKESIKECYKALSNIHKIKGDYVKALENFEKYKTYEDSLRNDKSEEKINELGAQRQKLEKERLQRELELQHVRLEAKDAVLSRQYAVIALIGIILLSIAFIARFFYGQKEKQKTINRDLERLNGQIRAKGAEIEKQKEKIEKQVGLLSAQNEEIGRQKENIETAYQNIRTLSEIGKEVTHHLSEESIFRTVYKNLQGLVPLDAFGIGIFQSGLKSLQYSAILQKTGERLSYDDAISDKDDSLSDICFKRQEEIVVADYAKEYDGYLANDPIRSQAGRPPASVVFIPLVYDGKSMGCLFVESFDKNAYGTLHLNILRNLGVYIAIALENTKAYRKSEDLLLNILPKATAEELKEHGSAQPRYYSHATVLFTDFKGFTVLSEKMHPQKVIELLNHCFKAFDEICEKYGLEKIKTIGDAYMCAGGIPVANETNPRDTVLAGLEMQAFMRKWKEERDAKGLAAWELRLGIHTGELIAGVIGTKKFAYDIWGDTVNTAARMESSGEVGKVNISGATYGFIKNDFKCEYRGKVEAKSKGEIDMYFVLPL